MMATMAAAMASQKLRMIDAISAWSLKIATNQRPLKPTGGKEMRETEVSATGNVINSGSSISTTTT